jgi:4-nitrophenyl phosphatase
MPTLKDVAAMIIDLDGVLWRGPVVLPGVSEFFELLRDAGIKVLLASNNSTARPAAIQDRLGKLGVTISREEVLTSALATSAYLKRVLPSGASIFVIGEDGIRHALAEAGFALAPGADGAKAVVVGMDRQVTYAKLGEAALAIRAGAMFVGTNPDCTFPTERGLMPGNGSLLAAVQAATDQDPIVIGKPERTYFELGLEQLGTPPGETLMLGDRLDTDILGGQQVGLLTCLVLTGVVDQQAADASEIKATWVYPGLPELSAALRTARHG